MYLTNNLCPQTPFIVFRGFLNARMVTSAGKVGEFFDVFVELSSNWKHPFQWVVMASRLLGVMEVFLQPGCCLSRVKTVHVFKNYGLGRSPQVLGQASTNAFPNDLHWPFLQIADSLGASQGRLKYCWGGVILGLEGSFDTFDGVA